MPDLWAVAIWEVGDPIDPNDARPASRADAERTMAALGGRLDSADGGDETGGVWLVELPSDMIEEMETDGATSRTVSADCACCGGFRVDGEMP